MVEILVGSLRIAFGLLGLAANVVQLVVTFRTKKDFSSFDVTVVSLNIADTVSSLFFTFYGLARILFNYYIVGIDFLTYLAFGLNFSVVASFNHIIFIALQRMFAVIFPLNVRSIITILRFKVCLILMWLSAVTYAVVCAFEAVDFLAVNSYTIFISGVLLISLYSVICYTTMRRSPLPLQASIHGNRSQRHSVLLHSFFITLGFVVCFFPFAVNYLFVSYDFVTVLVADLLVMLNTFIDVLVYFFIRHIKKRLHRKSTITGTVRARHLSRTTSVVTAIPLQEFTAPRPTPV